MDFDDFEDMDDIPQMPLAIGDPGMDMGGMDFNMGGMDAAPDASGSFSGIGTDFTGLSDFGDLGGMDGFGASGMGNFDSDFGMLDGQLSTASLPPLDSIAMGSNSFGSNPASAPPMWTPGGPSGVTTFGGTIAGAEDTRFTCCCCLLMFLVLFLLMAAMVVMGVIILVRVYDIDHDVNHLTLVTVQKVNPAPDTLPPQIIIPY